MTSALLILYLLAPSELPGKPFDRNDKILLVSLMAVQSIDFAQTVDLMNRNPNIVEGNPLMKEWEPESILAAGICFDAALIVGTRLWVPPKARKGIYSVFIGMHGGTIIQTSIRFYW